MPADDEPTLGELKRGIDRIERAFVTFVLDAVYQVDRKNTERQIRVLAEGLADEVRARQSDKRAAGVWVRWGIGLLGLSGVANVLSIIANLTT